MKRYAWYYEKTFHGGFHKMVEVEHGVFMLAKEVLPELDSLRARVAEMEKENQNIALCHHEINILVEDLKTANARRSELEKDCENKSATLYVCNRDIESLSARIAELEALLEWRDASEPPEDDRIVRCAIFRDCIWNNGAFEDALGFDFDATHWRDKPPMTEEKS